LKKDVKQTIGCMRQQVFNVGLRLQVRLHSYFQ